MSGAASASPAGRAGYLLGFSAGGFFDGIVLHQLLQWHHLLSAVGGDVRFQILADGYFHLAMYGVAALGLWRLIRRPVGDGVRLTGQMLVGFGAWHGLDAVLSHWLLQVHRIRMGVESPLLWDLGWLVIFGLGPLILGVWLLRRRRRPDGPAGRGRLAAGLAGALVVGAAIQAAKPAEGLDEIATVVFAPGVDSRQMLAAVADLDGRLVWMDAEAGLLAAKTAPHMRSEFYRRGALYVTGAGLPPACLDYTRRP